MESHQSVTRRWKETKDSLEKPKGVWSSFLHVTLFYYRSKLEYVINWYGMVRLP